MRQIVFKCDHDKKEIGSKAHVTLLISGGPGTGIAVPDSDSAVNEITKRALVWSTHPFEPRTNFLHFHNGTCAGKYFDKQLATIAVNESKKKALKKKF